jgi:membrane associated rhomboid family serine protease
MIPLRDENPSQSTPFVTWFLVAANVVAFLVELRFGSDLSAFLYDWALIPARLTMAVQYGNESVLGPGLTVLTSMFLHGGWLHLLGNMWYLWIFGDNVEDRLGHVRFLLFYLAAGVIAALLHWFTNEASRAPTLGASGAIAGVLGAYLVAFPRARVVTLLPFFPFIRIVALPAVLVLGLWFVFQFFSGALTLAYGGSTGGGIAWWAHIGGFAFGVLTMGVVRAIRGPEPSRAWVE